MMCFPYDIKKSSINLEDLNINDSNGKNLNYLDENFNLYTTIGCKQS